MSTRSNLNKETAALKTAIFEFIKTRKFDMARMILDQYGTINPADEDIEIIRNMIKLAAMEQEPKDGRTSLAEKLSVLNHVETMFILSTFHYQRNGAANSVLRKVKMMEDSWGYRPLILVCYPNIELKILQYMLQESDFKENQIRLNRGTRILSVYNYFQKSYSEDIETGQLYSKAEDGSRYVETARKNVYEVYDGDELVRKEFFIGYENRLRLVERFNNGKRTKGVYYDDWGYISSIKEYDSPDDSFCAVENFYTTDKKLCIKAVYSREPDLYLNGVNALEKLIVYDDSGKVIKECKSNAELAVLCLERIMDGDKLYNLVFEDGLMAKAAESLPNKNAARIMEVHSSFLEDPYDLKSRPQQFLKYLCENPKTFDGIVFLTHVERDDFQKKYGNNQNAFVIPHPYPYKPLQTDFKERDHKKAVIVSRFDPIKQIDVAIDIFALVLKKLPHVKLEIYGFGTEKDKYQEQIKRLGISENVLLMNFTDDPAGVFGSAALYMMTSKIEGYGITVSESICNGCPAFAFDIKYGPSDMIKDGRTGYLIPRFDKKAYAAKLIEFFEDIELQRTMSENCYEDANRFGADIFLEGWYKMTEAIYNR